MPTKFLSLAEVLQFIAERQDYLVNVCASRKPGHQIHLFQIVSSHFVFGDRKIQPVLYLTFDGDEPGHARFLEMEESQSFVEVPCDGIPCYALNATSGALLTQQLTERLLAHVFGVADPRRVEYVEENL